MIACIEKQLRVVKYLISIGANIDAGYFCKVQTVV